MISAQKSILVSDPTLTFPFSKYSHLRRSAKELLEAGCLEKGIEHEVIILLSYGIETFESCEGGEGHSYPEPTIRFHGDKSEGFRALAIALQNRLPVYSLRRIWPIIGEEPTGPWWEMTFYKPNPCGFS
jgi:hypothetical protein